MNTSPIVTWGVSPLARGPQALTCVAPARYADLRYGGSPELHE